MLNEESEQTPPKSQAERVIGRFGGIRKLQRALGHQSPTTVQGWKERGWIPSRHHERLLEVARDLGVPLTVGDFIPDGGTAPAEPDETPEPPREAAA